MNDLNNIIMNKKLYKENIFNHLGICHNKKYSFMTLTLKN